MPSELAKIGGNAAKVPDRRLLADHFESSASFPLKIEPEGKKETVLSKHDSLYAIRRSP